MVVEFAFPAEK